MWRLYDFPLSRLPSSFIPSPPLPQRPFVRARAPPYRRPVQSAAVQLTAPVGYDGQLMSSPSCAPPSRRCCQRGVLWQHLIGGLQGGPIIPFLFKKWSSKICMGGQAVNPPTSVVNPLLLDDDRSINPLLMNSLVYRYYALSHSPAATALKVWKLQTAFYKSKTHFGFFKVFSCLNLASSPIMFKQRMGKLSPKGYFWCLNSCALCFCLFIVALPIALPLPFIAPHRDRPGQLKGPYEPPNLD